MVYIFFRSERPGSNAANINQIIIVASLLESSGITYASLIFHASSCILVPPPKKKEKQKRQ